MPCPTARIACSDPQLATHLRRLFGDCEVIEDPRHCSQAPLCRWLDDAPLGPAGEVQAARTRERSDDPTKSNGGVDDD